MEGNIIHAVTDAQIGATFDVVRQLRPHLNRAEYVSTVRSLMQSEDLKLAVLMQRGYVRVVATYRLIRVLHDGRLLYIDDLVTDEHVRSHGYGAQMIAWLYQEGCALGCNELRLISGVAHEEAHRFYFREGFGIDRFHFRTKLG